MKRRRTSMGRQKVKIQRIESEAARQVCLSKRRTRLFKKAGELAILYRAEVAAVVLSPTGEAFSFGYSSVEAILERLAPNGAAAGGGGGGAGAGKDITQLAELNRQYVELRAHLRAEKLRKERADVAMAKERAGGNPLAAWLEADVHVLGKEELMAYVKVLAEVQAALAAHANHGRAMAARASSNNNEVQPPSGVSGAGMEMLVQQRFGFPSPY